MALLVEGEDISAGSKVSQVVDLGCVGGWNAARNAKVRPDLAMNYDDFRVCDRFG